MVQAARTTGGRAIFDLSPSGMEGTGRRLLQADAAADAVDLKISVAMLMEKRLEKLLDETGINRVWLELHPALLKGDPGGILARIAELSENYTIIPVTGSMDLIALIMKELPEQKNMALKGNEASGLVSSETSLVLYAVGREMIRGRDSAPNLYIWGGVASPEAAGAFMAVGAKGIVFESLHWLTDLVTADDQTRDKVSRLRPDHTDVVGSNLDVPCRVFNKGNSRVIKELKQFTAHLCGAAIRDEERLSFIERIQNESVHALQSQFESGELIPLGVEAAFASSFMRRFGSKTEQAMSLFIKAIEQVLSDAPDAEKSFINSPVAREMGTEYPFVQGAMSCVTDVPEFACSVCESGALPTVALSMMAKEDLDRTLGRLPGIMADLPYAVNVITLAENPHREAQLGWIKKVKPRFAVIAAGEPSHAVELIAGGIEVIYIAPNEELLRLAFEAGVRFVICEGNEAGGHVGQHSTLTIAQIVSDLKNREPQLFEGRRVILAGGIFNRETAFMAAMLGADAIQMGTVYLTTREIVETGALTALYQQVVLESKPGSTLLTGEGTGLPVRSIKTGKIDAICALERDFSSGTEDEASFRMKIEALSAGSLFVAAKGFDKPGGTLLGKDGCLEQGQFMSGACAGVLKEVVTLKKLHEELAAGVLEKGLPFSGPLLEGIPPQRAEMEVKEVAVPWHMSAANERCKPDLERIAITGMSVVNSLGNSPEEIWAASVAMKSGIVAVPLSKWDHEIFYHPRPRMTEKTYCKAGAFQNIKVSRKEIGVPPQDFRTMIDATKISMWLADKAIGESGILDSDIPRERISVLISQNSGEASATLQDLIIRGSVIDILSAVKRVLELTPEMEAAIAEQVKAGRIALDDTTLLGRLNCSAAGFICNRYGFTGPSFSVSAACATALVALYSAYQMIRNGVIDAAIVGGGEEFLTPMHFLEFSALGALAGLSGVDRLPAEMSRPFDAGRDGLVLGEGGGMIVIERESIAQKRGVNIHAYITSMGASNNNLGMIESSRMTQEIAIGASFKDASYGPESVDLVECHATSTQQGDVEEVQALKSFFNGGHKTILTSFKSQIGHTLGASGVNSLIRGVMAMKAGVLPATLNYRQPDPQMGLQGSDLTILSDPEQWKMINGRVRRFQVNAFGFGGSNYVVQVEEAMENHDAVLVDATESQEMKQAPASIVLPPEGVQFFRTEISGKPHRVSVVADSQGQAVERIQSTEPFADGQAVTAKRQRALARQGIHLGSADAPTPALAFVFPGQGSHYAGMGYELYQTFPVIRHWMDRAAAVAEFDLLHLLFHDREENLQKTRWQQPALFTMEYAMVQYLVSLGVTPTAMAGHSLGELTALCLSGAYSFEDGFRIVNKRALCMDKACSMNKDPGVMMAVDAPVELMEEILARTQGVYITNINSPNQIVIGGDTEPVKAAGAELKQLGRRSTLLPVSMAFHSPIMRCIHDELEEFIAGIEFHAPGIPVISNTTMRPFPAETDEIKGTIMAHLESPVNWMPNVLTLWNDYGVRLFVEVGPRDILSNLIQNIVEQGECIQTCLPSAEAYVYRNAISRLFVKGNLPLKCPLTYVSFPGETESSSPDPVKAMATSVAASVAAIPPQLEQIVQREINTFVMESFGKFLKPSLLAAIRRDYDPLFTEQGFADLLAGMFPGIDSAPANYSATHSAIATAQDLRTGWQAVSMPIPEESGTILVQAPKTGTEDVTEAVIRIIMDTTGYERDEIEPHMDLRQDLSIRSSRLPVIMDAIEGHFGIKIELEEFIGVRTIRDISDRIQGILARQGDKKAQVIQARDSSHSGLVQVAESPEMEQTLKRVVFREVVLDAGDPQPVALDLMDTVVTFSAEESTDLRQEVGGILRRDYGITIAPLTFPENSPLPEAPGFDLRSGNGALAAVQKVQELESLAGIIFIIDDMLEKYLDDMGAIASFLEGFFCVLKVFLASPAKKFALMINKSREQDSAGSLLAQGVLGMFLSAAHEFASVQFRTVGLDGKTDLRDAIRGCLDRSRKQIETLYRNGQPFTMEGHVQPCSFLNGNGLQLHPGDVVLFSGGGYGITTSLARSLAPFGCKMIFLGRTTLEPDGDFRQLITESGHPREIAEKVVLSKHTGLSGEMREAEISRIAGAVEILRNVAELRSSGTEVSYVNCDVTDPAKTLAVIEETVGRYGRIDGIVHGAGILRDNYITQMTREEFAAVVAVKFMGAWNLFKAAKKAGLKFFTCLSSAASIQGNPGQANYTTGNRIMSALLSHLHSGNEEIRFKAMMLPPVQGAGMAENEDIKALMKRMHASYIHVDELGGLFCRELFVAPPEDVRVLFMRSLPDLSQVRLRTTEPVPSPGNLQAGAVVFKNEDFPMIDSVSHIDLVRGELEATRTFSQAKDLWIADHKPFKFLKHPLLSAIMALETFMEACRILYPHFRVRGVRDAGFLDFIECPADTTRPSEIRCRRVAGNARGIECEATLSTQEVSPSGRVMDRFQSNFRATILLAGNYTFPVEDIPGFPVKPEELDGRPMDHERVLEWYKERTDMQGRYRVIHDLDGTASDAIRGHIIYKQSMDFAEPFSNRYQYSPYLLEALMHIVNFFIAMCDPDEARSMIPHRIGEMMFFNKCASGEEITLEARMKSRDEKGIAWNARALDQSGNILMNVRDIVMHWFTL